MEDCTHDCSTCASACEIDPDAGPSFFDRLEEASEKFDEIGEENIINMLNEITAELEKEEAAEEAAEKELGADVEEVMEEETEQ